MDFRSTLLGLVLLLALVIGGSSVAGLPTTFTLQLLCLPLLLLLGQSGSDRNYSGPVLALLGAAGILLTVQLLPITALLGGPVISGDIGRAPLALTADWNRTFETLLFFWPVATFFLVLGRLDEDEFNRLLAFFLLGLIVNMAFALVQFAASSSILGGFLPYPTAAGFFANQNHFAALLFVGIPFVVYQFVAIRRPVLSLAVVALMVFVGFATRSVAGAFLSLGCAAASYAMIANMRPAFRGLLLGAAVVGALVLATNPNNVLEIDPDNPLDRTGIWRNSVEGTIGHLPLGSGFGTFEIVYPAFEEEADITASFVNHAHNEYLELVMEGGLPALAALLCYFALLARAAFTGMAALLQRAAFCGLVFLLIHSLVDYPLRTMAMALVFALLNAIVFSPIWQRPPSAPTDR
ncbi:MAG: O-antigen ligase family protein [Devosia sp.]|uniref:O-antigen ligase family protein n=1 Tax=Devosia sp. TaxID=1871048 RepID=UPI002622B9E8|nr:O-antigen ligase family protein [Devosia sp.]MDB5540769.1 O-antigen ligase family protein [Devosia sp.]